MVLGLDHWEAPSAPYLRLILTLKGAMCVGFKLWQKLRGENVHFH